MLPYFADITIGFNQTVYSVYEEDENGVGSILEICVQVFGELDRDVDVFVTTSSRTAIGNILLHTVQFTQTYSLLCSFTPTAGLDYSDILAELRILKFKFQRRKRRNGFTDEQCFTVSILSDILVEDNEVFLVELSTDDSAVMLNPEEAEVVIINNDSE